jgi:glutamate synthase (ferredoxin)
MVVLEKVGTEDSQTIQNLLQNHCRYTQSPLAKEILDDYENRIHDFIKVMPMEYKRILESKKNEKKPGLSEVSDG